MMVNLNIISPQSNKPIIGIVQDTLLGAFKITSDDIFFTQDVAMEIHTKTHKGWDTPFPTCTILRPIKMWTGRSFVQFPKGFNYESEGPTGPVIVIDGRLVSGQLTKKHLGPVNLTTSFFLIKARYSSLPSSVLK
jgi:DNA-directed RNA polymerase II subunit RPB1